MAELDATRTSGWSYAVGWSQDQRSYLARAWKPRPKPLTTPMGVVLYLHTVSATDASMESAAVECSRMALHRDANDSEGLSEYERRYVEYVKLLS